MQDAVASGVGGREPLSWRVSRSVIDSVGPASAEFARRILTPCLLTEASAGGTQIICSVGWRSDAGYGWRTASRLISKRISLEPSCLPSSRGWFQVRPRSSRLRVPSAVKTARWPPEGSSALPRWGDRPADTADGQLSGQEPASA